ncbi:MAG TPA: class I SAM-dependent methyltransferase [Opitutales bacterium]|jgi:2-polyprenyl-3-methyl-5-hydroxy-6-metoxy-1,4-benzoquinol methylase|nr:class I SAM-dependent methyltransferase [Opitutales bacterium]
MKKNRTKEKQYQFLLEKRERGGLAHLGLMSSQVYQDDPRRLVFLLSRYKFVSKMFTGLDRVLEVGCADAFGTRIVRQVVPHVVAVDFDPIFIEDARARQDEKWPIDLRVHDMLQGPVERNAFDGAFCCDVLEHIKPRDEKAFVRNLVESLKPHGVLIVGMPSLESQKFASAPSKAGHVNCKSGQPFKELMQKFFHNVFMFSMNDEVVHTGFQPMAHYLFALCCTPRSPIL